MYVWIVVVALGCHVILSTIKISQAQVNLYITANSSTGRPSGNEECNTTGLVSEPIDFLNQDCDRKPVLAWIGAFADYSPWVDFAGCGIVNTTALTAFPIHDDFKGEPNIFACGRTCKKKFDDHYYTTMSNETCNCFFEAEVVPFKCDSQPSRCGEHIFCNINNVTNGSNIFLYIINSTFGVTETLGECGFVEISEQNIKSTGAMRCSENATVLCSDIKKHSTTITVYPSKTTTWQHAVTFCQSQNKTIACIKEINVIQNSNITDGTYWISSVRDFFVRAFDDMASNDTYCVAAMIQDQIKMDPIITYCNTSLSLACIATQRQSRTQCTITTLRTGIDHTSGNRTSFGESKGTTFHIILTVSGSLCLVITMLIIVCVCKWLAKMTRQKMVSIPPIDGPASHVNQTYGKVKQKDQGKKKTEKLELHQGVESNDNNTDNNIYDHTETAHKERHSENENYDTMAGIRNETEGIYDHSSENNVCESQNLYSTNCVTEDVYDSAGETNRNQVRNFANDAVYDSC